MTSSQTPAKLVPFDGLDFVPRFEHGEMAQLAGVSGAKDGTELGVGFGRMTNARIDWTVRVWDGIVDAFGRGAIGPLLGARRKDMPSIFNDERRGSGPIVPDPPGDGANFRQGRVAGGSWGPHPTAPPAPNPGGNSLPPNASTIPSQTLSYDEVLIVIAGQLRVHLGDRVLEAGPKDSIWLPKGTAFTYEAEDALIAYAMHPADWQDPAS